MLLVVGFTELSCAVHEIPVFRDGPRNVKQSVEFGLFVAIPCLPREVQLDLVGHLGNGGMGLPLLL